MACKEVVWMICLGIKRSLLTIFRNQHLDTRLKLPPWHPVEVENVAYSRRDWLTPCINLSSLFNYCYHLLWLADGYVRNSCSAGRSITNSLASKERKDYWGSNFESVLCAHASHRRLRLCPKAQVSAINKAERALWFFFSNNVGREREPTPCNKGRIWPSSQRAQQKYAVRRFRNSPKPNLWRREKA